MKSVLLSLLATYLFICSPKDAAKFIEVRYNGPQEFPIKSRIFVTGPVRYSLKKYILEDRGYTNLNEEQTEHFWGIMYKVQVTDEKTMRAMGEYVGRNPSFFDDGNAETLYTINVDGEKHTLEPKSQNPFFDGLIDTLREDGCDAAVLEEFETFFGK